MISTTREQSARLIACGVDPKTADMFYQVPITISQKQRKGDMLLVKRPDTAVFSTDTPAWSLSALLGLLPKEIGIDGYKYRISIYFENPDEPVIGNQWCLYYKPIKHDEKSRIDDVPMYSDNLIECAVLMVEWLTRHNYQLAHEVNFAKNKNEKK